MTDTLPEPKSRKEEFLAKAAGMSGVTLPEPASREEEYLNAIAKGGGGGGGSYTAGTGIDITDDTISVDTTTIQEKLTAGTGIDITDNTISATGGGPTVVQTTGTSTTDVMSQDATTKMIYSNSQGSITIPLSTGFPAPANNSISLGKGSSTGQYSVAIGTGSIYNTKGYGVAIGHDANNTGGQYAVALGANSTAWEKGVVSVGSELDTQTNFYNNTRFRKIVNVYDGENPHDAATKGQLDAQAGYNILPLAQNAIDNPEVSQTITEAQYLEIEAACMAGRPLYAGESSPGYMSYHPNISYECFQGSSINIVADNNLIIGGLLTLDYNGGSPTITYTPASS